MKKVKGMKYYFIAAAIALLAVSVAAPVGAGGLDRRLYGDYTYNVAATCANAPCGPDTSGNYNCQSSDAWGFNPVTFALRLPGSQKSYGFNIQGVIHFDGHGRCNVEGGIGVVRSSLGTPPYDIPANQVELDCEGTYIVESEHNELFVDITFSECTSTIKSGFYGVLGLTQKVTGPVTVRGRLDTVTGSNSVIIGNSNTFPTIEEIVNIAPPAFAGMNEQRICSYTGSIVKLSPWHWFSK